MGKVNKLFGKPQEFEIEGEMYTIYPLTLSNMDLLMKMDSNNEIIKAKAMKDLVRITLQKADPEATDEEIDQISLSCFKELTTAIMKVNGLEDAELPTPKPR